jgi:hypothetical protein
MYVGAGVYDGGKNAASIPGNKGILKFIVGFHTENAQLFCCNVFIAKMKIQLNFLLFRKVYVCLRG